MDNQDSEEQIDAIVGAALKAMAESGAGRARLGSFAASFRGEVIEILGRKAAKPAEPDLLELVTQAVKSAIADPAINKTLATSKEGKPAKVKASRFYVVVAGKATSVTLTAESVAKLSELARDAKTTKAFIQQLAESAPANANRSRWVQENLLSFSAPSQDNAAVRH